MGDAIVSFAIQKLGEFIAQQVNIRIGVREGVRWLKDELGYLQSSVRAAESRQENDIIRNWVTNVGDVANDAVLILQRFNNLLEPGIFKKRRIEYDIGSEIESLKERIDVVKKRRIEYGIDNILATPDVRQKKRTFLRTSAIDNKVDVVGFEDDIKTLMAELDSKDPSLKVILIHGMGGSGKTALATKLYNSSELRHFDTRAKVCVSNEYNIKDVVKRIIKSFMGPEHEQRISNMDEHDVLQYLLKLMHDGGRYFAVIDDIWEGEAWEQIKIAFPDQKNGSRIIITTRNQTVAQKVEEKCFVHKLRYLKEDESWQLFCKRAEPITQEMEKLGKEMVGKCEGLPLAIVVLSGLLLHKRSIEGWSKVKEHIWREVKQHGSFKIVEILSLSCNDLSSQLRDCFLYIARYPEDHVIYRDELKGLWIAEEFISEANEQDGVAMDDLAENYMKELIDRNLIQVETLKWNEELVNCRVHDLVRELAIDKAKEQKLVVIFDSSKHHPNDIPLLESQRRHVISNGIGEYLKFSERTFDGLDSLAVVNFSKLELKEMKLMYTRFKNLKVLDMRCVESVNEIPEEIGDLVLLKFLGLMGSSDVSTQIVIPASIGKLKKLQTLRGSVFRNYYIFPKEIYELRELRYLNIHISGNLNIGTHQTKLHTLQYIQFSQWLKIDTVNFTNLHVLKIDTVNFTNIRVLDIVDYKQRKGLMLESIANLTSLQTLDLHFYRTDIPTMKPLSSCNRLKRVNLRGTIRNPLELGHLPHSVTDLSLKWSKFTEDPMPTLRNLLNLTALQLVDVYKGKKMVCSRNAFPSLQILRLLVLEDLEELQVEDGALPSLKCFQTVRCGKLETDELKALIARNVTQESGWALPSPKS